MNYLFPVKLFYRISKGHVFFTWTVFVLFVSFPTLMGYVPTYEKIIFTPSDSFAWTAYFSYMDIIHTRVANVVFSILLPVFEIWIIFLFSGLKRSDQFKNFILPFITYAYIGIILRTIDLIPGIKVFSPPVGIIVNLYFLIFFIFTAIKVFSLKPMKSTFVVLAAFVSARLLAFLLTGPAIGMMLQELSEIGV